MTKMAAVQQSMSSETESFPYDSEAFDSMAVINSEFWNEGEEDEKEPFVIHSDLVSPNATIAICGPHFLTAAQKGSTEAVKTILERFGEEILGFKDDDGYTALHRASYNGHVDVVKLLLSSGANVLSGTEDGWQPLHCACKWNKVAVASLLLQNGAKVNAGTNGGQTPLHLAATNERGRATLELLLHRHDIDATLKNAANETAYDVAVRCGPYSNLFEIVHESMRIL